LVGTDEESAIWQPGVAGVVVRDVRLFLQDRVVLWLERVVVLNSVELVGAISSN